MSDRHTSTLLRKVGLLKKAATLRVRKNRVSFRKVSINSYFASTIADLIRQKLLSTGKSFSFETVMSHPDKIDFLAKASAAGYRNYLYFITTNGLIGTWCRNSKNLLNRVTDASAAPMCK